MRTALAVEARDGKLHVFFPPLYAAEDWLDLAASVEDTAEELGVKVVLEGYPPPRDPRMNQFSVTPDPGVIEVNIHPAEHWAEMVEPHHAALPGRARGRSGHAEIHARRPPCRHRRRQPRRDGRRHAEGQPVPAPPRSAEKPARLLAQPSEPVLRVQRPVHRPHQPASAHRRSAHGQHDRAGNRLRADLRRPRDAALADRPPVPQHPRRHHGKYPPHRILHRQDVCAGKPPPAASVWSNSARSKCRPMRRMSSRADAADARRRRRVLANAVRAHAGALGHPPARRFHAAAFRAPGFPGVLEELAQLGFPLEPPGSRRTWNSASRRSAMSPWTASASKSATRSSPGTCWARNRLQAAPCAMSTAPPNACRRA